MRNRKNTNNNMKNFKDYLVPIITFILIFILLYIALSGWDENTLGPDWANQELSQTESIAISFWESNTSAIIVNTKDKKTVIASWAPFVKWDTLKVTEWSISFKDSDRAKYILNKNGELIHKWDSFSLESSDLWIESKDNNIIKMRFAQIIVPEDAIVSLNQNEVSSSIYAIRGKIEVTNLEWASTFITTGKKISISNQDASKNSEDIKLDTLINDIDDYFKVSPWYLNNKIEMPAVNTELNSWDTPVENVLLSTGTLDSNINDIKKTPLSLSNSLLNFDSIYDEGNVTNPITKISGTFADDSIAKITIAWIEARINPDNKTFVVSGVPTGKKENDIAIKIFNTDWNRIGKYLYTLYYSEWNESSSSSDFATINTTAYPVKGSDFIISIPTVKKGVSYSTENTFFGTVKNPDVASVYINGYRLKTFNWKTFRYHAYKRFKTLWEWVNNYEIKYTGKDGKIILKKYVTINKTTKKASLPKVKKIISWEAQAQ